MNSAKRTVMAPPSCSGATSRRRSPISRASQRRMPPHFASGTARVRESRPTSSCPSVIRSRCHKLSAKRCCHAPCSAASSWRSPNANHSMSYRSCSRTSTCGFCSCSRSRCSALGSTLDVHQTFEKLVGRGQLPEPFRRKLDGFQYTPWALYGLHLALHESPRFAAASFDPNIDRALKWSIGAETMEDLFAAHRDVQAGRVPRLVQFGSGPLSLLDPTQAPPGKHTTYAWHVMPLNPDLGGQ